MKITPTKEVLFSWMDCFVPEKDLFFLSKEQLQLEIDFTDVLVMPIDEFDNHSKYQQLNYVNSYEYWNLKNVNYVIIAEKEWIESISEEEQQLMLSSQVQNARGLVLPVSFVHEISQIPSSYVLDGHVIIQRSMWEKLNEPIKEQILTTMLLQSQFLD